MPTAKNIFNKLILILKPAPEKPEQAQ